MTLHGPSALTGMPAFTGAGDAGDALHIRIAAAGVAAAGSRPPGSWTREASQVPSSFRRAREHGDE